MNTNRNSLQLAAVGLAAVAALVLFLASGDGGLVEGASAPAAAAAANQRCARSPLAEKHHSMMHNHLSRKVFDRACAASKDTIDEIIACLTNNEGLMKAVKLDTASACYKEAFNAEFDPKEVMKHKELICNNREKFEVMTTCIYRKTGELMDAKEMEKLTETLVDVGLCIINALDG